MRICSASFQLVVSSKTHTLSGYVCPVPMAVIAIWLFGGASIAASCPSTQPAAAPAARPYSGVTQILLAAMTTRPAKVAAIDEDDGDDDQADPDDPNDTVAAADAFWRGTADVRASQTERERQLCLEVFANRVVQAA
jgi:hypothetical protein